MTSFPSVFQAGRIGKMATRNRLVMPPMVLNYADASGRVTDRYVAHIARVAEGGVGTLIVEASFVANDGKGFVNQLGIATDDHVAGLRRLVDAAHRQGACIGPQLYHSGRQSSSRITNLPLIAPSALPCPLMQELPQAMSRADIERVVTDFAAAARRARAADFDFLEIHGAHGYLLMQFMSAVSNRRDDEYGGSLENRMRFPLEIVAAVREAVGADFPLSYRLSADEGIPGGVTTEEAASAARMLQEAGIDALHVSVGSYGSYVQGRMIPPMAVADAPNVELAAGIRAAVSIPVIAVGKCRTPELAEDILLQGKADFVAIGRSLLADPDWPKKAANGEAGEINRCIACNQGCISRLFEQHDVWCTVNPETGREAAFRDLKLDESARVLVVGGGPAGLVAARVAALAGAQVTLHEQGNALGGQLPAAAAAPYRGDWMLFGDWLKREVDRLGVSVRLGSKVDPALVRRENPDFVVVATGAQPVRADFRHTGSIEVLNARDVLEGRTTARGRVLVVGAGCAGVQTAEYLAARGNEVTVIEAGQEIATDMPMDERHLALARLHDLGIDVRTGHLLLQVTEAGADIRSTKGDETLAVDTVLLCLGSLAEDGLVEALMQAGWNVALIGDARKPRRVTDAVAEAALAVRYFAEERRTRDLLPV